MSGKKNKIMESHDDATCHLPDYIMSPECVKVDTCYAISIAPTDDYQHWSDEENRLKNFVEFWQAYIQILTAEVLAYTEVSKLGRLHFHGTIKFKTQSNINTFYIHNVHPLTKRCMVHITLITDELWDVYMTKSKHMDLGKIYTTDANLKRLTTLVNVGNAYAVPYEVTYKAIVPRLKSEEEKQLASVNKQIKKASLRLAKLQEEI